jgi:uncharacterized protein YbcV (DUF1398 family)
VERRPVHATLLPLLAQSGRSDYAMDFRRSSRTYYRPDGETLELKTEPMAKLVTENFDASVVKKAIREAQEQVPGYTYKGFCEKMVAAGCAGYVVSIVGKRVLYYGRTAETHTEYFPGTRPKVDQ